MREILFRGKRKKGDKRWVEGDLLHGYSGFGITNRYYAGSSFEVVPETVGQYTGLTDKNGAMIFEGDVVKSIAAWYVVEFENGGYGLRPFGKGKLIPIMGHGNFNENEVEVIGNIYDNSELLEVEEHE